MSAFGARRPSPAVRKLRRRLRAARRWSVMAGTFGGIAAVLVPVGGVVAWDAIWTALFGGSAVMAAFRWHDYRGLARALPKQREDIAVQGVSALSAEAHSFATAVAGKLRRARSSARFRNTAAAAAFQRLERAARAFDELSDALEGPAGDVLDDVHGSQRVLVDLAGQIRSVEKSIEVAPPERRDSLHDTLRVMVERLDAGVSAYEETVGAAAQVVAEQGALNGVVGSGMDPTMARLNETSSKLHGLADGIGEMRQFHTGGPPIR